VTEVVEAVARSLGIPPERRADVFRAAQQVCAEELRLARTGFTPAPLSELAERAVRLLPSDLGGDRIALGGWTEDAPFPEEPLDEAAAGGPSGEPFPDEADVFAAAGEPMVERRLAEPSAVVSEAAAREGPVAARADDEEEEAPEEIEFEIVDRREPRGGKLAVFLLVVAIAGGIWFFAKTRRVPPASPSAAEPDAAGSTEAPAGAPASAIDRSVPAATTPSMAAVPTNAAPAAPPPPAIPESHGSTMLSPDWPGAPVWMIHFSSYQRKENAERDAARLAKIVGGPLHVIGVNLGATQGLWFRVMMGEYRTREEARAARDALAAKGTPGLGFVYRVEGLAPSKVEGLPPASRAEPPDATRAPAL
jgi:cell division protein FtsN